MAIMAIEITAAQARQMTGRCGYHGCALQLVSYPGDSLENILDGWECPGLSGDPDGKRLFHERVRLDRKYAVRWERKPPEVRERIEAMNQEIIAIRERCQDSWVLTVPDPE